MSPLIQAGGFCEHRFFMFLPWSQTSPLWLLHTGELRMEIKRVAWKSGRRSTCSSPQTLWGWAGTTSSGGENRKEEQTPSLAWAGGLDALLGDKQLPDRCSPTWGLEHGILQFKGGLLNHHDPPLLCCFGKTASKQTRRANLIRCVLLGVRFTCFKLLFRGDLTPDHWKFLKRRVFKLHLFSIFTGSKCWLIFKRFLQDVGILQEV